MLSLMRQASPRVKLALRNMGRKLGFEIRLTGISSRDDLRFVHFLDLHQINMVLDVGANRGQFAQDLFKSGYKGQIISFEPLPDAHAELVKAAAAYGKQWVVGPRVALSDKAGRAKFFVTSVDASSSLLEPLDSFIEATPVVRVEQHIDVETVRLDDLTSGLRLEEFRTLLKLDVQGSEARLLAGASQTLKLLSGVLIEISFANLYAGQSSAVEVQQKMVNEGFELWDIWRGYSDPHTLRLNQVDACFFRPGMGLPS